MPARVTVWLQCDRCKVALRQAKVGETIASLRERLVDVGWRCDDARDSDVCPACMA